LSKGNPNQGEFWLFVLGSAYISSNVVSHTLNILDSGFDFVQLLFNIFQLCEISQLFSYLKIKLEYRDCKGLCLLNY